jgi:hypothetical protein
LVGHLGDAEESAEESAKESVSKYKNGKHEKLGLSKLVSKPLLISETSHFRELITLIVSKPWSLKNTV